MMPGLAKSSVISRAGFRQWRRKYQIENKPAQLKLEQLELALPDSNHRKGSRRETIAQKMLARKSGLKRVEIGDVVSIEPDLAISHDNTGQIIRQFSQYGIDKVWDPSKIIITLDQRPGSERGHESPAHRSVREFVKKQKIKTFYDIGQGIGNQLILENALILPGQLALSTDAQASCYGSLGAFSTSFTAAEMAAIWATGKIWLKVPQTIKINLNGRLPRGVYAKDIMLKLARDLTKDGAEYKVVEFYGNVISSLTVSERVTLTCLAANAGLKTALVPFDDLTARYLRRIVKTKFTPTVSDSDAAYCNEISVDVSSLTPRASSLYGNDGSGTLEELEGKRVEQVVLGCCANGRIDDLELAAKMLRGHRISHDVRMMIIPGSRKVLAEALERSFVKTFIESGCIVLSPGCGPCVDAHDGYLEPGELAVTTASCVRSPNCSFSGTEIYQVSPATAVATAIDGAITDPRKYLK